MKNLLKMCLVAAFIVTVSGTAHGLSLHYGAFFQKTLNYEAGTGYFGGVPGTFYGRTDDTTVWTREFRSDDIAEGPLPDVSQPLSKTNLPVGWNWDTFGSLATIPGEGLKTGEDAWGLLRVTSLWEGNILGADSRFGDGSDATLRGNDISASAGYYLEGFNNEYLRGIMYGQQDQVVQCISATEYRIWSTGGMFDIYLVNGPVPYTDPSVAGSPTPADRPAAADEFGGWFDDTTDTLVWSGDIDYFRFQGNTTAPTVYDGETEVLIDLAGNKVGIWDDVFADWWATPDNLQVSGNSPPVDLDMDIWQSWNIGDPFVLQNGWLGSEDSGRGYIPIPEPVTMLGVFLGLGSLGGYIRKRRGLV